MDKTCADRVSDIVLEDLSVTFPVPGGTSQVLRHVSYTFSHEKITALVGESGSGKSILGGAEGTWLLPKRILLLSVENGSVGFPKNRFLPWTPAFR